MQTSPRFSDFQPSFYQNIRNQAIKAGNALSALSHGDGSGARRAIQTGYEVKISPAAHQLLELLSPYQRIEITRKVASLSADPRPSDAAPQKSTSGVFCFTEKNTKFSISFKLQGTRVYVLEILPNPKLKGESKELPRLYLVNYLDGAWQKSKKDIKHVDTAHAAVNGQSNVLDRAAGLMGKHVSTMFKEDNVKSYTLFHNPSDGGFWDTYESSRDKKEQTTAVSKLFAAVLADIQEKKKPVKWLAHSQGGLIFTEATRYHWVNIRTKLDKNSVQFNAGANNEKVSQKVLGQANIKIHGFNNHPFDPVPNIVGGNAKDWVSLLGSAVGFGFVFTDNPEKSPHTTPYQAPTPTVNKVYNLKNKGSLAIQAIINTLPQ